jgi:hypothetical protein
MARVLLADSQPLFNEALEALFSRDDAHQVIGRDREWVGAVQVDQAVAEVVGRRLVAAAQRPEPLAAEQAAAGQLGPLALVAGAAAGADAAGRDVVVQLQEGGDPGQGPLRVGDQVMAGCRTTITKRASPKAPCRNRDMSRN